MNDVWFHPGWFGAIGLSVAIIGFTFGPFSGYCSERGNYEKSIMGVWYALVFFFIVSLTLAWVAYFEGQNYSMTLGFGVLGVSGIVAFGMPIFSLKRNYREAEMRKSLAKDIVD